MSDHEAKSRSIKELKAKKHHEKLSLLRASVKEILHREKMELQYVILFGSYVRGDFNGFSDVDLIVVDHNPDQAERLSCSIQEQGLADDVLTLSSVEWNRKKKSNDSKRLDIFSHQTDKKQKKDWLEMHYSLERIKEEKFRTIQAKK